MNEALLTDDDDFLPTKVRLDVFSRFRAQSREFTDWLGADFPELDNLHASEREALRLVAIWETLPMAELAIELKLGISTTSLIVHKLEKLGLCVREKHEFDGRSKIIHFNGATPRGKVVVDDLTAFAGKLEWKFSALTASELENLLSLLKKL